MKIPEKEKIKLYKLINNQTWRNAKTFEKVAPHSYIVLHDNKKDFNKFCKYIEKYGRDEIFQLFDFKRKYRYLYLGDYRYWRDWIILNRTRVDKIVHKNGVSYQEI